MSTAQPIIIILLNISNIMGVMIGVTAEGNSNMNLKGFRLFK